MNNFKTIDLNSPLAKGIKIKNNILAFSKSALSQWYGAYQGQEHILEIPEWELNFGYGYGSLQKNKINFNCAEQAMMYAKAMRFNDNETADKILKEKNPKIQKKLGREVKNYNDQIWSHIRFDIVNDINQYKFSQNLHLKEFLLSTGNYTLAEISPKDGDLIWSTGCSLENDEIFDVSNWKGQNLLGVVLMKVRTYLNYGK
jgi:ribA/ribD-fused uncharacterized protein